MQEYYEEWRYITYYFSCHVVGQGQLRPTPREIRVGLEPRWLDMQAAQKIFATHESFDQIDEEKRGIYQRENLALQAFLTAKESRSP